MTPDRKRSIAFMNSIPADVWRGGEKWMVNAAAGLALKGHSIICIGRTNALWLEKARARNLETLALPIHSDFDPFIITRLIRILKQRHIDILCCNFEKDVRLGGIAAKFAKVKKIFVRKGLSLIFDKLRYRLSYRYIVDEVISPAQFIKDRFKSLPWLDQNRLHVIPNGVFIPDTTSWNKQKLREITKIPDSDLIILGAGRIFGQKGFNYLVDAVALLRKKGLSLHIAIAGGGEEEALRNYAERQGVAPFLHLLGHRDDVLLLMYSADIFVLSSIDEGLPNVVLEAMSAGTPVVAANAGGTAEIITNNRDGYVVPVRDAAALAEKIELLVNDQKLRKTIGAAGLATVTTKFSIPVMVDRVEELFCRE